MNHKEIENYINKADDGIHSVIGASSAKRWLACPGSVQLSAKCPKPKVSKYAEEGTKAHRCCELVMKGEIEAWELQGIKNVTNEMIDAAMIYEDQVFNRILKPGGKLEIEKEFHLKDLDERAFGTADCVVINPGELHVIDFKYGAGVVVEVSESNPDDASGLDDDIPSNPQLMFYALGAYQSLKKKEQKETKIVYIWVIQPRASHIEGPVRFVTLTPDKLLDFREILKKGMEATLDPKAPLNINPDCRWCHAFNFCPEQGKIVTEEARLDFADSTIFLPEPRELSPKSLATILAGKPVLESWLKSITEYAKIEMQVGLKVPGFKLVNGRSNRVWTSEKEAISFLGKNAFEKKLISPAQAEKLVKKLPEYLVKKTPSGPTIALASDKRKEYIVETVTDFDETF